MVEAGLPEIKSKEMMLHILSKLPSYFATTVSLIKRDIEAKGDDYLIGHMADEIREFYEHKNKENSKASRQKTNEVALAATGGYKLKCNHCSGLRHKKAQCKQLL